MDCRQFREKHLAFVDDTLAGVEHDAMQAHATACGSCQSHDTKVRRALLLFRNLPPIQPSAGFGARLQLRLRHTADLEGVHSPIRRRAAFGVVLAAAAMLSYIATTLYSVESPRDLLLQPVVATTAESEMTPLATPPATLVASAPSGLSIWSAAMFAEEAPVNFIHTQLAATARER